MGASPRRLRDAPACRAALAGLALVALLIRARMRATSSRIFIDRVEAIIALKH
jgi:hypothetical protein